MSQIRSATFLSALAFATPVFGTLMTSASTGSFISSLGYDIICPGNTNSGTNSAAASCHIAASFTGVFDADAEARASYGSIGAFAQASMITAGQVVNQIQFWAEASASFSDTLRFFSSNHTSGFVQYVFDIDGSSTIFPGAMIQTTGYLRLTHVTSASVAWQPVLVGGRYQLASPLLPIFFGGSPVGISASIYASVFLETYRPGGSGGALVDFLHTAQLTGLQAFDNTGAPISDFTVTSASGTVYPIDSSVPEPDSLFLVLAGLAALLGIHPKVLLWAVPRRSACPVACPIGQRGSHVQP